MNKLFAVFLSVGFAVSAFAAENLVPAAIAGQTMPDGITAEVKDGKVLAVVSKGKCSKSFWIPLNPEWKVMRLTMEFATENVVKGKQSWQDGRLAMEFRDAKRNRTGKWLSVFAGKGNSSRKCKAFYEIPPDAKYLKIEPANFGESGKVTFKDLDIRGYNSMEDAHKDQPKADRVTGNLFLDVFNADSKLPKGMTSEVKDGKVSVFIDGGNLAKSYYIVLRPEWKVLRLSMNLKTENVVKGKQSWQDGRLDLEFRDYNKKRVGKYPHIFSGKGTVERKCDRIYEIPEGAYFFKVQPSNLGTSGKVSLIDIDVRGYIDPADAKEEK